RLTDELRAVVAPDALRRPSPPHHSCQHPSHVRPVYRPINVQRQALPCVYSSTSVSHLSGPPLTVRSATKSYVHTSSLNRAGRLTQLLALVPRLGPRFLPLFRRIGRWSWSSVQSRWTRLRFTCQPSRSRRAWMKR